LQLPCHGFSTDLTETTAAGKLDVMPWNEIGGLQKESSAIAQQLAQLNRAGYLTINSQPRINAAPSDDASVGWGGASG